jgi:lipopolysaccharide transport system ATP-binding protein
VSDTVINACHLGKRYAVGRRAHRPRTVRDALATSASRMLGVWRGSHASTSPETFWALDDVSFQIRAGDVVGIIGRNGAGKSTLLKVLSQITEPTTGFADITGRVGSLLEVGTGFHEDLTGRENTYLNGAILGMKKAEIDRKFDEIVAFAEIDRFIDTPVKHYSSGMYMRLAFAVAAHLETEILVVDEVLAVGDAQFQKKCIGKMDAIARHGRTVLFISHNIEAIQRLCTRGMLLDRGRLIADAPIDQVVAAYRGRAESATARFDSRNRRGTGWARFSDICLVTGSGHTTTVRPCDKDLVIEMTIELDDPAAGASLRGLTVHLVICAEDSRPLVSLMNIDDPAGALPARRGCTLRMRLAAPTFVPGRYRLNAFLGVPSIEHVDEIPDALEFEIGPPERPWRPYELSPASGAVCRTAAWDCLEPAVVAGARR